MRNRNGELPAMSQTNQENLCMQTGTPKFEHMGLTKREMFAMHAMQALISNAGHYGFDCPQETVMSAVIHADMLLSELDK